MKQRKKIEKKKIGVIGLKGLPAQGGAATVGENIIKNLTDEFIFVVYATSSYTSNNSKINSVEQVIIGELFIKKLNSLYYNFISVLHALIFGKYDLIHVHHTENGIFVPLLKLRYKVICTAHGRGQFNDKWGKWAKIFIKFAEKLFLKFGDEIVSVSKIDAIEYSKLSGKNVKYIPNGVNQFDKAELNKKNKKLETVVFSAGRIIPIKGCDLLLEAFQKGGVSNELIVIGDLEQKVDYKSKLMSLSKGLNVTFTGLLKDKEKLFNEIQKASLFVFPSKIEAMSMMLLEVVSLGVPVLCSDIDANKAIFSKSEVKFFKSGSADDLLTKINWVKNNYCEMLIRSEKAKSKLQQNYNWAGIANQYSNLYHELMI